MRQLVFVFKESEKKQHMGRVSNVDSSQNYTRVCMSFCKKRDTFVEPEKEGAEFSAKSLYFWQKRRQRRTEYGSFGSLFWCGRRGSNATRCHWVGIGGARAIRLDERYLWQYRKWNRSKHHSCDSWYIFDSAETAMSRKMYWFWQEIKAENDGRQTKEEVKLNKNFGAVSGERRHSNQLAHLTFST